MRMLFNAVCAISLTALSAFPAVADPAGSAQPATKRSKTVSNLAIKSDTTSSADVVKGFFAAFGKGDVDGVVNSFHPNTTITAVRKSDRKDSELHGTYTGKEGARTFVANLGKAFDTQAFNVANVVGDGKVAFANGTFVHKIRSTGKLYSSDWALMVLVEDGKIREYKFFEDSAKFAEASN
jgi:uncharacterized protein